MRTDLERITATVEDMAIRNRKGMRVLGIDPLPTYYPKWTFEDVGPDSIMIMPLWVVQRAELLVRVAPPIQHWIIAHEPERQVALPREDPEPTLDTPALGRIAASMFVGFVMVAGYLINAALTIDPALVAVIETDDGQVYVEVARWH